MVAFVSAVEQAVVRCQVSYGMAVIVCHVMINALLVLILLMNARRVTKMLVL